MNSTFTYTGQLTVIECGGCHIDFAMPTKLYLELRNTHATFWCPRGHARSFTGTTTEQQLRRQLEAARAQATHEADQRIAAERSATAYKGHATRLRKRASAGVCPCCTRTFSNVARHMASQHPDFGDDPGGEP